MDARDLVDKIMFDNYNMESLLEILNKLMIELDNDTMNSRDRKKILKAIYKFSVIIDVLVQKNKMICKKCDILWDKIVELESNNETKQNIVLQ